MKKGGSGNGIIQRFLSFILRISILKVRVNEYDARGENSPELSPHREYNVVRYSVYPRYKAGRFLNDLAILHLDRTVDLVSFNGINAACLPPCVDMFGGLFRNGTGVR